MAQVPLDLYKLVLAARNDNGADSVHVQDAKNVASKWLSDSKLTDPVATQATTTAPTTQPTQPAQTTPTTTPTASTTWTKPYWLGEWSGNVKDTVRGIVQSAGTSTALLVAYNIPGRDNGNYSAGGLHSSSEYATWIQNIADGIGYAKALFVLEPDALGLSRSLSDQAKSERYAMLNDAVKRLKTNANTKVYVDSSIWAGVDDSVALLNKIKGIDGFSCNVSGYLDISAVAQYARGVSLRTGLTYVVDTSRNGNGAPRGADIWCNQTDTKVGQANTAQPTSICDAYLWIKVPGESDGKKINGKDGDGKPEVAPSAGTMWPEYRDAIYSGDWTAFKAKYKV